MALRDVYFGFDLKKLFIRVDFDRPARLAALDFDTLRIGFVEPADFEVRLEQAGRPEQRVVLLHQGVVESEGEAIGVGLDKIVEIGIPFAAIGAEVGESMQFFIDLLQSQQSRDRAPREGSIHVTCPSADFERITWDV